jgi:hypothetical protein
MKAGMKEALFNLSSKRSADVRAETVLLLLTIEHRYRLL